MWCSTVGCIVTLTLSLLAPPLAAAAQPSTKVPRIGILSGSVCDTPPFKGFQEGLRELGYVEGQNIVIECRAAQGNPDRLLDLAAELMQLQVAVILATSIPAAGAATRVTTTIPIVLSSSADPVAAGLVESLARPGGNVTGLSDAGVDVMAKRVELLAELMPTQSRVAILWNPTNPVDPFRLREARAAAQKLGLTVQAVEVSRPEDLERAFAEMVREGAGGFVVVGGPVFFSHRKQLADLALRSHVPGMSSAREYVEVGGLMSYGTSLAASFRRAATYVDKILKGAKPANLPIEQPMTFELVINLKTAEALGLTIPPIVLFQATEVIQ